MTKSQIVLRTTGFCACATKSAVPFQVDGEATIFYCLVLLVTITISLQALIQYNDKDDLWASNLRFAWLRTANAGPYVVCNELQEIDGVTMAIPNRSLTVKYIFLFELLK